MFNGNTSFLKWTFKIGAAFILIISLLGVDQVGAAPLPDARVVINIPSRTLWLYEGEKLIRYYSVGVGRPQFPTPLGHHKVQYKMTHPGWENPYRKNGASRIAPGRGNPLGTRWISFKDYKGGEYGIHGTNNPGSVGKFSSHGCVRMKIKDAEDLYEKVDVNTPVEVVYETVLIRPKDREIRVVVYPDAFRRGMPTVEAVTQKILDQFPEVNLDKKALESALHRPLQKPVAVGVLPSPFIKDDAVKVTRKQEKTIQKGEEHDVSEIPGGLSQIRPEVAPLSQPLDNFPMGEQELPPIPKPLNEIPVGAPDVAPLPDPLDEMPIREPKASPLPPPMTETPLGEPN